MNDPTKEYPVIYFVSNNNNQDEKDPTPLAECPNKIKRLTEEQLTAESKPVETGFTEVPLIIKFYYKYCATLSIIDTPGLRESDPEAQAVITKLISNLVQSKRDAILVYVQSCQEDWSNTPIFNTSSFIRTIDPSLSRTFLVASKFDDRVKNYVEKEPCEDYLNMKDMGGKLKTTPHFISIPTGLKPGDVENFPHLLEETYCKDIDRMRGLGYSFE